MPFTTKDIVKKHILDHHLGSTLIENEPIRLTGNDSVSLQKRMILKGSEKVKAKEQLEPVEEIVSFTGSDTFDLSHSELIPDTVVVAGDSSLGTVYLENIDYHIDYDTGEIKRIDSGSLAAGASVVIWYLYYRIYQRGVDYDIDYHKGNIRRRSSGDIESGQRVLVDYTAEYGGLDDEAIDNAITEAHEQVLSYIDDTYHDSADRSLVSAETYLTVSIICRIRAMEAISPSRSAAANATEAKSWSVLSDTYKKEAYVILSRFTGIISSFKSPSKT
jgi:hypothetical protein